MTRRRTTDMRPMEIRMADPVKDLCARLRGRADVLAPKDAEEPILAATVRGAIFGWLAELNARDELAAVGIKPRASALLSGPPGCGKTTLAHHLAARLGVPLVIVGAEHLIERGMGDSEQNVRRLFDVIESHDGPCVLLLDEIDALGSKRRDTGGDRGGAVGAMNSVLTVLLRRVEAFEGVLIGATNRADALDAALWRRFGMQIEVALPDDESRWAIIKRYGEPFDFGDDVLDALCDLTSGAAPSLLRQLMEGVKRALILGPRMRMDASDLATTIAVVVEQCKPHPDYDPPALWAETRKSLGLLQKAATGQPWPPTQNREKDAA